MYINIDKRLSLFFVKFSNLFTNNKFSLEIQSEKFYLILLFYLKLSIN